MIKVVNYDDLIPSGHRSGATAGEQGLGPSSSSSSMSFSEPQSDMITLSDRARHTLADVIQFAGVGPGQGLGPGDCPFTVPTTVHLHHHLSSSGTSSSGGGGGDGKEKTASGRGEGGVGGDTTTPDSGPPLGRGLSTEETALRARLQLSQEMYHKLSVYFLPFTLRLMALTASSSSSSSSSSPVMTQSLPSAPIPTLPDHTPGPSTSAATNTNIVTTPSLSLDANNTNTEGHSHTAGNSSTSTTIVGEISTLLPLHTDLTTQSPSQSQSHPSSTSSATAGTSATSKTLTNPFFGSLRRHSKAALLDASFNTGPAGTTDNLLSQKPPGTLTPRLLDISVNFTEWNHRAPPAHLPLFPYGRNHSSTQLLWFENENLAYHSKSGFLAHLFPQVSE